MTPTQHKALLAYRDQGVSLSWDMKSRLVAAGHLTKAGVIITDLDTVDTRSAEQRVADLFAEGKTLVEVCKLLKVSKQQVYRYRNRMQISEPTKKTHPRKSMMKSGIPIGTFDDFLAAYPNPDVIIDLAAAKGITFFAAAGQILRRNS